MTKFCVFVRIVQKKTRLLENLENSGWHVPAKAGLQRAASPWRTQGIRSCRTFCSDLA